MLHITLQDRFPALALTALLGWASFGTPSSAAAQTINPERALLNRIDAASQPAWPGAAPVSGVVPVASRTVDGERALLARSSPGDQPAVLSMGAASSFAADTSPLEGEQALLGRRAAGKTPRVQLAAELEQASRLSSATD